MSKFPWITICLSVFLVFFSLSCGNDEKNPTGPSSPETREIHGITFISLSGGTFQMGWEISSYEVLPLTTVSLNAFEMSIYEITNARYAAYLNEALSSGYITVSGNEVKGSVGEYNGLRYLDMASAYDSDNKCWISYSDDTFSVEPGKNNRPVVYVTWFGAKAFVLYYGFDLPVDAEWEYAAKGGKQYEYGTDDGTIDGSKANYDTNVGHPVDVGSYPANPFGFYDMCGNVWEWCSNMFNDYLIGTVTNQTEPQTDVIYYVKRSGGWRTPDEGCRSVVRMGWEPDICMHHTGFRVFRRPSGVTY